MGVSGSKPHEVETQWYNDFVQNEMPSLKDKTIAVTGCTSGTGLVFAKTTIKKGAANVLLLNRPSERASKAEAELKKLATSTNVESIPCDLQDFASVKQAATTIKGKYEAIDVLCNNAGVMALQDVATKDGYDVQMQTNHLSHFLLTKELYPLLKRAKELRGEARVVNHSSLARNGKALDAKYLEKNGGNLGGNGNSMFFGGARWERYHQTKLANTVFTQALKERFGDNGIKAVAAAPGLAATNLQVTTDQEGGMGSGMWIMRMSQSAEDGTMPLLSAAYLPSESGKLWEPSRRMHFVGPAQSYGLDPKMNSESICNMLWEKSEEAVGKFDVN